MNVCNKMWACGPIEVIACQDMFVFSALQKRPEIKLQCYINFLCLVRSIACDFKSCSH